MLFHFIKQSGLKGFAKKRVVEVFYNTPKAIVRESTFSNKTVKVRVPLQRASESMKNTDEAGDKVFGFIHFVEQAKDNTPDSMKKAVEKGTVFQKEMP